jgi:hypothetical protein
VGNGKSMAIKYDFFHSTAVSKIIPIHSGVAMVVERAAAPPPQILKKLKNYFNC